MEISEHLDALGEHGVALADAADKAGLDAEVPTCPDWQVRDLLGHLGQVHRWAASFVASGLTEAGDSALADVPGDVDLVPWFRDGHAALVRTLSTAPVDVECWSFLPAPSPLAFWARRQAHETAIHRADAESALGTSPSYPAAFAVDGIDELLLGFYSRKGGRLVADPSVTIGVRATDASADDAWTVALNPDGRQISRGEAAGDCVLSGAASDLYLLLWNRRGLDGISVTGDAHAFDVWREKARITWS